MRRGMHDMLENLQRVGAGSARRLFGRHRHKSAGSPFGFFQCEVGAR